MNPALPGGAQASDETAGDAWALSGRVGYTYVPYGDLQQGRVEAPNPSELSVEVHLATVQVTATAPSSTALDLQLPMGSLVTHTLASERSDQGIGDLELRLRQGVDRWSPAARKNGLSFGASLGWVFPTGPYVARSGAANLPPEASFLTLGRGVNWALAEVDARVEVGARASALVQLSARVPVHRASDEFAWGTESRATLVGQVRAMPWLVGALASDITWRGGASEPDPFDPGMRLPSANVGGWQWTAAPSVSVRAGFGLGASLGLRIPLLADVTGNQLVPSVGGFLSVSYSHSLTPARAPAARPSDVVVDVPTGVISVVDYWAEWCAPCATIEAKLVEAAPRWNNVKVIRIDASELGEPGAPVLPDGLSGLPVVEIFGVDGKRAALLTGDDALRVVEIVDDLRRASGMLKGP